MRTATPHVLPVPRRAVLGPAAYVFGCAAGVVLLLARDPATTRWFPTCPMLSATGWLCPACGLTRAAGRVVRGDLLGAFGANQLWPVLAAALALGWWVTWRAAHHRPRPAILDRWNTWATVASVVLVVAFTVVRNTWPA